MLSGPLLVYLDKANINMVIFCLEKFLWELRFMKYNLVLRIPTLCIFTFWKLVTLGRVKFALNKIKHNGFISDTGTLQLTAISLGQRVRPDTNNEEV